MAEEDFEEGKGDHLPGIDTSTGWAKITAILAGMVLLNVLVAFASWGWGIIITLPFTVFLAVLLFREMLPRHRFPTGRRPGGAPT
jgi:hypothetical protein